MEIVETAARWAYEAHVPVMLNPAPAAPLSDSLLHCLSYLSPNEHEAALLSGQTIGPELENISAVTDYFAGKGVDKLIITLGEAGSVIADKNGIVHIPSVKMPNVADTTAAGDSFVAAFCTGLAAGLGESQALNFASYCAAITVTGMGAIPSLPNTAQVQALMVQRGFDGFDAAVLDSLK